MFFINCVLILYTNDVAVAHFFGFVCVEAPGKKLHGSVSACLFAAVYCFLIQHPFAPLPSPSAYRDVSMITFASSSCLAWLMQARD